MDGGLVVLLAALQAFEQIPGTSALGWEILLTPDEETGSHGSAPLFAEAAARQRSRSGLSPRVRPATSCNPGRARAASPPRAVVGRPTPRKSRAPAATPSSRSPNPCSLPPRSRPSSPAFSSTSAISAAAVPRVASCPTLPNPNSTSAAVRRRSRTAPRPPPRPRRRDQRPRRFRLGTQGKFQLLTERGWPGPGSRVRCVAIGRARRRSAPPTN